MALMSGGLKFLSASFRPVREECKKDWRYNGGHPSFGEAPDSEGLMASRELNLGKKDK
jgi:hypothetical protein